MKMTTVSNLTPASDIPLTGPMALEDAKHAWLADADHAISALAVRCHRTDQTFTADDVHKIIGDPEHPNWWGVAFASAKRRGEIELAGYAISRSKSRNGGVLRVWRAAE